MDTAYLNPESANGPPTRGRKLPASHHDAQFQSQGVASGTSLSMNSKLEPDETNKREAKSVPRQLVLCFDGTGNKFHGDDSDTNILKIFRLLDRTAQNQYHYYQPGIGTYVVSNQVSQSSPKDRFKAWYLKAKDMAIGSSFDHHVLGGYRFLMQFYNPGDEIYIFGFSRGAYIARFLAEMLDFVGLLTHGNEEMIQFAWQTFSQWQCRRNDSSPAGVNKKREMFEFMKGFRETFSRPVRRIRFLGLFDTVNSVPRFETAWMGRSKFPYTARTSAEVVRHAVSIDERRAKFRQDLLYQSVQPAGKKHPHHIRQFLHDIHEQYRAHHPRSHSDQRNRRATAPVIREYTVDNTSQSNASVSTSHENEPLLAPHRLRSRSRSPFSQGSSADNMSTFSDVLSPGRFDDSDTTEQDIFELLFAGDHCDVGGGWDPTDGTKPASHVPLTWMVREAMRAGLCFDAEKVAAMGCSPAVGLSKLQEYRNLDGGAPGGDSLSPKGGNALSNGLPPAQSQFHDILRRSHAAPLHDSLCYRRGLGFWAVTGWKLMEYLPFRRMDLSPDGSWKPIRWPLPCGEVRDIPDDAHVHGSVIHRMKQDPGYRPGNLIVGGGGRGFRFAPAEYGMGEWVCIEEEGDIVGETWTKKRPI